MPLVTCPGCGKKTSDSVSLCVYCGCARSVEEKRRKSSSRRGRENTLLDWLKISAGLFVLGYAFYLFRGGILSAVVSAVLTVFSMVREILLIIINL